MSSGATEAAFLATTPTSEMFRVKKLCLVPPLEAAAAAAAAEVFADNGGGFDSRDVQHYSSSYNMGEFIHHSEATSSPLTLPAAHVSLEASTVLVAFKSDEPVLKILQPGGGGWVEHRCSDYGERWAFLDACAFAGRLYAATTHGRVAEVEFLGAGKVAVTLLETEIDEEGEGAGKKMHHIFDAHTDRNVHVLELVADAEGIKNVTVYW